MLVIKLSLAAFVPAAHMAGNQTFIGQMRRRPKTRPQVDITHQVKIILEPGPGVTLIVITESQRGSPFPLPGDRSICILP
jgi:hypothetical protein